MKNGLPILGVNKLEQDGLFAEAGHIIPFHTHCHTYFEMLFYQPFEGNVTVNGQTLAISCPTVLLLTPSDFHSTHPLTGDSIYHKLCFTAELIASDPPPLGPLAVTEPEALALLAPLFIRACESKDDRVYLAALIRTAYMTVERTGTPMAAPRPVPALRLTRDVIHIVNAEFATDLTLSDVAARLSVSPQHLSAVFSQTVGMTFRDYLGDRRLRFAASLLASGEANVTEACMWSGYRNLSHFGRAFRKRFGVPPKQYRESTL